MPLTIAQIIGMYLRKTPIAKVREALKICEAAGIQVTALDLESHSLCRGDPVILAKALTTAKQLGVDTSFHELAAVALARKNLIDLVHQASKERVERFDTFSPTREDKIRGFTKDQTEVFAEVTSVFRLSVRQLASRFDFRHVHERLGAAISVYINTASDFRSLQLQKSTHEAEMKALGADMIPAFKAVVIEYRSSCI